MECKVAVIGLGYVGLPVVVHFSKYYSVIGFDQSFQRIEQLKKGIDHTNEISASELIQENIVFTNQETDLQHANFYIITVPTPIDNANQPDLTCLKRATETVAKHLKPNDVVVYESTVYPGTTEEICIPILQSVSNLCLEKDFLVGYSPERINPGDKDRTLDKVVKIVSGNNQDALNIIYNIYSKVITAGLYKASSIKVAEAAKIIENTQRDLNVALMNELAIIFNKLGIDTHDVLAAAKTKWNFCHFTPGLVGGHCIGVDPYYLTYKAQTVGYHPEVILAGRRINDSMGKYIATQTVKEMLRAGVYSKDSTIGILGITFKEDCNDIRNSKVFDIINEIESYGIKMLIHDPIADIHYLESNYRIKLTSFDDIKNVDALIIAVNHRFYKEITTGAFTKKLNPKGVVIDIKGILDPAAIKILGFHSWRLY
jgi:UDP-N-acetyl-D-glucosamine/UDP-N-acetyl-D-galactosamine dehydrogenase